MRGMVGLSIAVAAWLVAPVGAGADPLDKAAFTATPAELLAAATAAPRADEGVVILREDASISVDSGGLLTRRTRLVFVIQSAAAVDDWGTLSLGWQPFYQATPVVKARVISLDGSEAALDPTLIHEAPAVNESPTVFSDRRVMSAPLPRLAVGVVVEEEFVTTNRAPLLRAGEVAWQGVTGAAPIAHKVIELSWPVARPIKLQPRGPGVPAPVRRTSAGRTTVRYEFRDVAVPARFQPGVPSDYLSTPYLGLGTGASWQAVAAEYRSLVEAKLAQGVALPAELRGATQRATVDKIMAWLHARVRYTGIELSDSAIIPFTPAETLARGFGDCKDKATLTVSLLRAAGIAADVALLQTGPSFDTDPALPGMGDFDHAIVRAVVDGKPLWIDATEDLLPAGQLPGRDQGRRALVIAAGTAALTVTPIGQPADNLNREVRTFHLAEADGAATVTEVATQTGIWAADLRGWVRATSPVEARKSLTDYATSEYHGTLASFTTSDPDDLATPFTLTLEATAVGRAHVVDGAIDVWIFPRDTLDHLPDTITDTDDAIAEAARVRQVDYVWARAQTYEIVNRLELPPGYTAPDLPTRHVRPLGTMSLTTTRTLAGRTLTIAYRLDTGKRRISAAELRATRAAVAALNDERGERVALALDAATLEAAGKAPAAATEYRRLIALHPGEALHHSQLALLYVNAGLGVAARREATLATTLEPTSSAAWVTLGFVLRLDRFGRAKLRGGDRAAAIAAYRKALALLPSHAGAASDLAMLLSVDDDGAASLDTTGTRAAAVLLAGLHERDRTAYEERLMLALAVSGDVVGLERLGRTAQDAKFQRSAQVLAVALREGGPAALKRLDAVTSAGDRSTVRTYVAGVLLILRRYADLRTFAGADPTTAPAARALYARLGVTDPAALDPADPTTPAKVMMAVAVGATISRTPWDAALAGDLKGDLTGVMSSSIWALPRAVRIDVMTDGAQQTVTPLGPGRWRVTLSVLGTGDTSLYIERQQRRAVLVGGGTLPDALGRTIMAALKRQDLAAARLWATAYADDAERHDDGSLHARLARLHRAELATGSRDLLELLGAMLQQVSAPALAGPIARRCAGLTADADLALCRSVASVAFSRVGAWTEAVEVTRAALAAEPDRSEIARALALGLARDGKLADARGVLDAQLGRHPADDELLMARFLVENLATWPDAQPWAARVVASASVTAPDLNTVAWEHAIHGGDLAVARALIERAITRTRAPDADYLNTHALIAALQGDVALAVQQLHAALDQRVLADSDAIVVGALAEAMGLPDDAVATYRTIARPAVRSSTSTAWDFAQRRLTALGQAAGHW